MLAVCSSSLYHSLKSDLGGSVLDISPDFLRLVECDISFISKVLVIVNVLLFTDPIINDFGSYHCVITAFSSSSLTIVR